MLKEKNKTMTNNHSDKPALNIDNLIDIMERLRDPDSGCPWDKKQTYQTIIPFTIEEVYEVADAIYKEDFVELKNELGDLLFQVIFYCQLAKEESRFDFNHVVHDVCQKLTERHPHVFSDVEMKHEKDIKSLWEKKKQDERLMKSQGKQSSAMDDIPKILPALKRSQKMQKRAANKGFDWPDISGVWQKIEEESLEVKEAIQTEDTASIKDEVGDLLFACVNLSRHLGIDAEQALTQSTDKFEKRFRVVENIAEEEQKDMSVMTLEELDQLWDKAKRELM